MSTRDPDPGSAGDLGPAPTRDLRPGHGEEWSPRNQTLRHAGEKHPDDDDALFDNPHDWSALGGPEDERSYGRTRSDVGYYPWNSLGGPHDRDTLAGDRSRGGYLKKNPPHVEGPLDHEL